MRGDLRIDGETLAVCDVAGGLGERHVDVKSALVDDGIEDEERLFRRRQWRQCLIQQAREHGIALCVIVEDLAFSRRRFIPAEARRVFLAPTQRPRHLPHEKITPAVLSQRQPERGSGFVQRPRQSVGQGQAHRANLPLQWNFRPAVARLHDVRHQRPVEHDVVRNPVWILLGNRDDVLGDGPARKPDLWLAVINHIGDTQDVGRRVAGVAKHACVFERDGRPRLDIEKYFRH